jgi:hypothetical protein
MPDLRAAKTVGSKLQKGLQPRVNCCVTSSEISHGPRAWNVPGGNKHDGFVGKALRELQLDGQGR